MTKCYLCGEQMPKDQTEVRAYTVPSATRGGTLQGVKRYVRMCRIGHGCRANDAPHVVDEWVRSS